MNSNCPSCGALYNVASKDVGRRLKCKKCSAALTVTDAGLELDTPTGSPPPDEGTPAAVPSEVDDNDDEPRPKKRRRDRDERADRGPRVNPIAAVGGIPTILFAVGVFFVILFMALPVIGRAGTERAKAYEDKLKNDKEQELLDLKPKNKKDNELSDAERKRIDEKTPEIESKYTRLLEQAKIDAEGTRVSNIRLRWLEMYGLMFGFVFLAFGCIGYLRTEQALVLKIVAGAILTSMMLILFMLFAGCQTPRLG